MLFRMPSIHPKQSSASTASGQVTLALPELFLWNPTHSSFSCAWFFSSHTRSFEGDSKNTGFIIYPRCYIASATRSRSSGEQLNRIAVSVDEVDLAEIQFPDARLDL